MLTTLTTLFLLTAISFAVVVMVMTLRDSWDKVLSALAPVYAGETGARAPRRARRITRRPATLRLAPAGLRAAA